MGGVVADQLQRLGVLAGDEADRGVPLQPFREVADLPVGFVNARVPVELPVGEREAIIVPAAAVASRSGLDFVTVIENGAEVARAVVLGEPIGDRVEVLTGLRAGDEVVVP